jgi:hypothetical protein
MNMQKNWIWMLLVLSLLVLQPKLAKPQLVKKESGKTWELCPEKEQGPYLANGKPWPKNSGRAQVVLRPRCRN